MSNFKKKDISPKILHCQKSLAESILALKVFDQCRVQKCVNQGPVTSFEKCTCIIIPCDDGEHLGSVILPGRPVCLPASVSDIKIMDDSMQIKKILISSVSPSNVKKDYWDIEIKLTFIFKIQLFDINMNILKILRCPCDCKSLKDCNDFSYDFWGCADYVQTITLFGSNIGSSMFVASDIFPDCENFTGSPPHALVEAKAYVVDSNIAEPYDICDCTEVCDGTYDEPIKYIYITIGIYMIIRLCRLVNLLVDSKGYDIPKPCNECSEDACETFNKISFPVDEFFPSNKNIFGEGNNL